MVLSSQISKLVNIGIKSTHSFEEEIRIKALNGASLMFTVVLLFFITWNSFYTQNYDVVINNFAFFTLVPLVIWLQKKEKYTASIYLFFVLVHVYLLLSSMVFLIGKGAENFHIVVVILILIFSRKAIWATLLIILNAIFLLLPQIIFNPYLPENYSMINVLGLLVLIVLSVKIFNALQDHYKEKLEIQKERLEDINNEKNDLITIVAHDLKSPLDQVSGLVTLIKLEDDNLNERQNDLINRIINLIKNENQKIGNFLVNRKTDELIESIEYAYFNVVDTVKVVMEKMFNLANAKNIKFMEKYHSHEIAIYGCEDGFIKIVSNLVSNAIKYSNSDTTITIEMKDLKWKVLFTIEDQGQGFKKEELNKVFKKHSILSATPTGLESASGVGLYIVKKYVGRMMGKVWLESKDGEGSKFFVKFPKSI